MFGKTNDTGSSEAQHHLSDSGGHSSLREKFHELKVDAIHLKHRIGKFANLANSNHRHDEEHEQETDAKRTAIAESHRFQSFAPERDGNRIKWYVDGRDYFHAVSVALERAKETIYIADWWLSPEMHLRRPPHFNDKWRLDFILKRAAERGVKIYVIVYKEVKQALTCNSAHTKHALEALCPKDSPGYGNIVVMRHPDHNVFENASDMTFYWAHHEKFIVVDYDLAFIGGLDLCFGRWDVKQHPLADVHPADPRQEVFVGQSMNNNRILDFQDVQNWKQNQLDKTQFGRMPWHDVAMGVIGPCIYDIAEHFVLRWNFCKRDKYKRDDRYDWLTLTGRTGDDEDLVGVQRPKHPVGDYIHHPLSPLEHKRGNPETGRSVKGENDNAGGKDVPEVDAHGYTHEQHRVGRGTEKFIREHGIHRPHIHDFTSKDQVPKVDSRAQTRGDHQENDKMTGNNPKKEGTVSASGGHEEKQKGYSSNVLDQKTDGGYGTVHAQIVRSSADWSSGILTEQSIQNAYCEVIRDAKHFVYIENQFFITATGDKQSPIHNLIGAAIVDACVAAAKENRKFRVIILIPSIPGFAGDLRSDAATGTRAIMDYQYKSICRGEESIFGKIKAAGFDPSQYIFLFNLRSYDRINNTPGLVELEKKGIKYEDVQHEQAESDMAKAEKDDADAGRPDKDGDHDARDQLEDERRQAANKGEDKQIDIHSTDSIAKNALLGQKLVSEETWSGRDEDGKPNSDNANLRDQEKDNFIQEELYIHGKLLIVDDRIVICGSSNINDRSQLGFHDSELAIVMEDTEKFPSLMDGKEYQAGKHAATLRRILWREHLGLIPPQPLDASDDVNAQPPEDGDNDWLHGDEHDELVADPLSDKLWDLWTSRATTNTEVFRHLFHADPDDNIRTFADYDKFLPSHVKAGHLFDQFQPVDIVRQELDRIKGHLVWMPLHFLCDAEMAEKGVQVNTWTESVYT